MTTIATDGKSMAADRLVTGNGTRHGECDKLARANNGDIIGAAGRAYGLTAFLDWYNGPQDQPFDGKGYFEALVLRTDGRIRSYDEHGRWYECAAPQAIGSGDAIAYGALEAGADAYNAVRIAALRDTATGGGIDVISL